MAGFSFGAPMQPAVQAGASLDPYQDPVKTALAKALIGQGFDNSPIRTPLEGFARMAQTAAGAMMMRKQRDEALDKQRADMRTLAAVLSGAPSSAGQDTSAPGTADAAKFTDEAMSFAPDVDRAAAMPKPDFAPETTAPGRQSNADLAPLFANPRLAPYAMQIAMERMKRADELAAKRADRDLEPPKTRTIKRDGVDVTEQWDPVTRSFKQIASSDIGTPRRIGDTREFLQGDKKITQEWDGQKWVNLGAGPAYKPEKEPGGPFAGNSLDAQAYNIVTNYQQKKANGLPTTPQEDYAFTLAKQHLEAPRVVGTPETGFSQINPPALPAYPGAAPVTQPANDGATPNPQPLGRAPASPSQPSPLGRATPDNSSITPLTAPGSVPAPDPETAKRLGVPVADVNPFAGLSPQKAQQAAIRAREEGLKNLEKNDEAVTQAQNRSADVKRFLELNGQTSTGPIYKIPGSQTVAGAFNPALQEMSSITDRLTPGMRQGLPGAASDRDIAMFRNATIGPDKSRETNQNIGTAMLARDQNLVAKAQFERDYLDANGHLQGADRAWRKYLEDNPIFDPGAPAGSFRLNPDRMTYQEYFRGERSPAGKAAGQTAAAGGGASQVKEGDTATNPRTGEKIVFRNGQWEPLR